MNFTFRLLRKILFGPEQQDHLTPGLVRIKLIQLPSKLKLKFELRLAIDTQKKLYANILKDRLPSLAVLLSV